MSTLRRVPTINLSWDRIQSLLVHETMKNIEEYGEKSKQKEHIGTYVSCGSLFTW